MGDDQAIRIARQRLQDALQRTAARDARAFRTLYQLSAAKLFGITLRICEDRKAAEDVMQEAYLSIWMHAGSYEPSRGSAIAWLAAVARNRAIDWRRRNRPGALRPIEAARDVDDGRPAADTLLLLDERERLLHECLEELEARSRAAIRTAFFEGLTYAELAARDNVPLGTMKSVVRRGLMHLRECLDDDA